MRSTMSTPEKTIRRLFKGERARLWAVVVLCLLTRAVYVYHDGMPEPDSVMVAAGVALGATGDVPFSETFLYGKQLNPGVFLFMRAAHDFLWHDPRHVADLMNWISVICAALSVFPLYSLFRIHLPERAAWLCLVLWSFTPLVWESHTYFHPMIPATLFLLLALDAGCRALITERVRWGYAAGACACSAAALITRTEIVFAAPAILVFVWSAARKRRAISLLAVCLLFSVLIYALVVQATAGEMSTGTRSIGHFWDRYRALYGMSYSLHGMPRSIAWAAAGLGLGSVVACVVACLRRPGQKKILLVGGLLWAIPSLVFWLPYIVPILRHYYLSSIGITWLIGLTLLANMPRRHAMALVGAIILFNLFPAEIAYRLYNRAHPAAAKTPHGTFFYGHETAKHDVKRLTGLRSSALTCGRLENGKSGSIVLCRWDAYTNIIYGIASQGTNVRRVRKETLVPEVGFSHYTSDSTEVQLISFSYMQDPNVRGPVEQTMMSAWRAGSCVFVPRVVAPFDSLAGLTRVVSY